MFTDKDLREKLYVELKDLSAEELQAVDVFIASLKQKRHKKFCEPIETYPKAPRTKEILNETLYPLNEVFDEALELMSRHYGMDMRRMQS
jgi:hypothetical protein